MFEQKIKKVIEEICPNCLSEYKYALLNNERYFSTFGIHTDQRLNHFLSQVIHESQYLTRTHENLNYSFDRLLQVWPKKFKNADPSWFHRKPEAIANFVYYKRMGNVNPTDGWKYRGRGLFQITGKWMYSKVYEMMKHLDSVPNFVEYPDATLDKRYILGVACCVWNMLKCDNYADKDDIKGLTKRINGGYNGLKDRIKLYERIKLL